MNAAACLERQSNGSLCRLWNRSYADSSQVFIRLQEIIARALNDLKQMIHGRYFLELLS
jgi:hypothetical protein